MRTTLPKKKTAYVQLYENNLDPTPYLFTLKKWIIFLRVKRVKF